MKWMVVLVLVSVGIACSDDRDQTPRKPSECGRECADLLLELEPDDQVQLLVRLSSTATLGDVLDMLREADSEVVVVTHRWSYESVLTDREGVEFLCSSEDVTEVSQSCDATLSR